MEAPSASRRCGSAAWIPRNGPRQLTRQLPSNAAGVSSPSEARCNTPALFTNVVNAPNRATVVATAVCHCSAEVTSSGTANVLRESSASAVALTPSTSRSQAATQKPSATNLAVIAAP